MKKILLLGRQDDRPAYDTALSMQVGLSKFRQKDIVYYSSNYEDLSFIYEKEIMIKTSNGVDLRNFDAIFQFGWFKTKILEDMALSIAKYAQHHKILHMNQEALYTRSRSKLSQYVVAGLNGLSTIPFAVSMDKFQLLTWAKSRDWPLIVKAVSASRGNLNFLVKTIKELDGIIKARPDEIFVVQAFVENDGDYRLIIVDHTVKLAIHRKGEDGSHLNNTSKGGQGTLVNIDDLPINLINDAQVISRELRREIGGVDMIIDKRTGKHYFLEANNMPQLSTGSNVSYKLSLINEYLREQCVK